MVEKSGTLCSLGHKKITKKQKVNKESPMVSAFPRLYEENESTTEVMVAAGQPHWDLWKSYVGILEGLGTTTGESMLYATI